MDASAVTFHSRGFVLVAALAAYLLVVAQQPLALAVADLVHGRTALVAAIGGRRTTRLPDRLVAAGAIAKSSQNFFCCVTTRGLLFWASVPFRCLPFASPPFRLGMPLASFQGGTEFLLPLARLPTTQPLQTFRVLAVALLVPPRPKSPAAVFVEASAPSQQTASGTRIAFLGMLDLSHGR
jgi:hypothetical protein